MLGALNGILVLDLSRLLPGPYCSMILADHGARVIAIEDKRFEKESLSYLDNVNRNKEHITLNLKTDKGKEIFFELAKKADVVIEGFRPGVTERLGVSYEDVKKINPGIIYCSITGYGQTGPLRNHAGHDLNFSGYSGILSLTGFKDTGPCIPGIQIGDISGSLNAAIGILLALHHREKTGKGQYIDISITDSLTAMLPIPAGWHWTYGKPPERGNWLLGHRYAWYNVYQCKDGKYITMGALELRFWKTICEYFGVPQYIALQYDENKQEELLSFFRQKFAEKSRNEWLDIFKDTDVCIGSVSDVDEVLYGENVQHREMMAEIKTSDKKAVPVLGIPIKLSETPGSLRTPPPRFGENTDAVLKELGLAQNEPE